MRAVADEGLPVGRDSRVLCRGVYGGDVNLVEMLSLWSGGEEWEDV